MKQKLVLVGIGLAVFVSSVFNVVYAGVITGSADKVLGQMTFNHNWSNLVD